MPRRSQNNRPARTAPRRPLEILPLELWQDIFRKTEEPAVSVFSRIGDFGPVWGHCKAARSTPFWQLPLIHPSLRGIGEAVLYKNVRIEHNARMERMNTDLVLATLNPDGDIVRKRRAQGLQDLAHLVKTVDIGSAKLEITPQQLQTLLDYAQPSNVAADGLSVEATDTLEDWLARSNIGLESLDIGHPNPASETYWRNPLNSLQRDGRALSSVKRLQINGHLLLDHDLCKMDLTNVKRLELTYLRHLWDEDVDREIPLRRVQHHFQQAQLRELVFVQIEQKHPKPGQVWRPSYNLLVNLIIASSATLEVLHIDGGAKRGRGGASFPPLEEDIRTAIASCPNLHTLSLRRISCSDTGFFDELATNRPLAHLSIIQSHFPKWKHGKSNKVLHQDEVEEYIEQYASRVTIAWNTLYGQSSEQVKQVEPQIYDVEWSR